MANASVKSALEALAAESAKRFQALLDGGEEIPYEVHESDGTQLPQYSPVTERFVRERIGVVRESEAFVAARDAIGDQSGRYLEELALVVPPEPAERAEQALIEFLARVWSGSSAFELDAQRVGVVIGELEGAAKPAPGDAQLVTSLIGVQIPLERLELAGATVVRADLAEVPADARRVERSGTAPWEPVFLAILRAPRGKPTDRKPEPVGAMLRRLMMTLRLFKVGGVATGPHAWVSAGGERWRQVSTGAPRPRAGGYRLTESELSPLADLARAIRDHPRRLDPLQRALARFEAGLERGAPLDSLNDHLLALRYMLEGDGPARTGLAMRAAALSAPDERDGVKAMVERAQALERELWSGEPAHNGQAAQTPAHLASDIEELVRRILREVARGRLGSDLRAAADEALLGDGLSIGHGGEGNLGGSAEWGPAGHDVVTHSARPESDPSVGTTAVSPPAGSKPSVAVLERPSPAAAEAEPVSAEAGLAPIDTQRTSVEPHRETLVSTQATVEPGRVMVETEPETTERKRSEAAPEQLTVESAPRTAEPRHEAAEAGREAWIDEVDAENETIEWPARPAALQALDASRERPSGSERAAHLFPRADTEWKIGELMYERSRRRAQAS